MTKVLIVDDDPLGVQSICAALRDAGHHVDVAAGVQQSLAIVANGGYDVAIVDVMMPSGDLDWIETKGGFESGVALARRLKAAAPTMRIVGTSQVPNHAAAHWFETNASGFWSKSDTLVRPHLAVTRVARLLSAAATLRDLRTFVVHGHDIATRTQLVNYLVDVIGLSPPTVLVDEPWRGRTMVEKFEDTIENIDVVFVLLTPDDVADTKAGREGRARQNVVFELGYCLGLLARRRGRVILLYREGVAIPSDLTGVGYIDITQGIEAAGESIRRELESVVMR